MHRGLNVIHTQIQTEIQTHTHTHTHRCGTQYHLYQR